MKEYMVISGGDLKAVVKSVNSLMEEGWNPSGNITAHGHGVNDMMFYQAMVK